MSSRSRRRSPSPSREVQRSGRTAATSAPKELARAIGATLVRGRNMREGRTMSPASLLSVEDHERLIMPSDNGSVISHAALMSGLTVVAGSLRNASAVARWLTGRFATVGLVPAGEEWPDGAMRVCYEDLIGAGAIAAGMARPRRCGMSPEVRPRRPPSVQQGVVGRGPVGPRARRRADSPRMSAGRGGRRRRRRPGASRTAATSRPTDAVLDA